MLAERLGMLRKQHGFTKKYMGLLLQMTPEGYGHYENGTRNPNPETIALLAEIFSVSTDYLLGREDNIAPLVALDDDALELMEQMRTRDEMRTLFSVSRKASKKDIEAVNQMLKHMVEREDDSGA